MTSVSLRSATAGDVPGVAGVAEDAELFPAELSADLVGPALRGEREGGQWLVADVDGMIAGMAWVRPEPLTESTWNLVALGVIRNFRGAGFGRALLVEAEARAVAAGASVLIIETSSTDSQTPARRLYKANGYVAEARIRDYWSAGDDKVIFWKRVH